MRPLSLVKIKWTPAFAYAIGLIATDGSLSKDGRHISFTSKDYELVENFNFALGINNHIGRKGSGVVKNKRYFVVQIGDVNFYRFLLSIGLMPNKSKTITALQIPDRLFFHFLRGCFDGDGSFNFYWDKRWPSSFMFYTSFASASPKFIIWLRSKIYGLVGISGHMTRAAGKSCGQLRYAKAGSTVLFKNMYTNVGGLCLSRKYLKFVKAFDIIKKQARVVKLADTHL